MKLVKKFLLLILVLVSAVALVGCNKDKENKGEKRYHMFNLATGFYSNYDPYWSWHSSLVGTTNNPTGLADEELDEIMETMRRLEPDQKDEFAAYFVQFVQRWNELLPNLPLYSNEYFDIYNKRIEGLQSTPVWGWSDDIADIRIKSGANKLVVGTPQMNGDFVAGFGSNAYDVYVRDLIHGYGTLVETENGEFVWDTVAVLDGEPETETDDQGNKTYTFKLQDDLKWNNGEAITAKDYVASMLLLSSKDWTSIATSATAGYDLLGYWEYYQGAPADTAETSLDPNYTVLDKAFKGVRLIDELTFSLTIDAANLPYFYETVSVSASPIDVETYLPGFDVVDTENGAKIVKTTATKSIREVIAQTVNDPATGQRRNPTVTSGPYQFVQFENQTAVLELNPNFKTNYEGKRPTIQEVQIKYINQETDVDQVIAGTVDLVNGVIEGAKIDKAIESPNTDVVSYPRNGYGLLAMICYAGPTQHKEVRQAIGYLFDRNVFINDFLGGYGSLVNGPYGEAQWFYQQNKNTINQTLINYELNIDKANELLDQSPYRYEKDGKTPFDPAKAKENGKYYRYNDKGEVFEINHLGSEGNEVSVIIANTLTANAWKVGMKFSSDQAGFDVILDNYYYGYSKWNN